MAMSVGIALMVGSVTTFYWCIQNIGESTYFQARREYLTNHPEDLLAAVIEFGTNLVFSAGAWFVVGTALLATGAIGWVLGKKGIQKSDA